MILWQKDLCFNNTVEIIGSVYRLKSAYKYGTLDMISDFLDFRLAK